MHCTFHLNTSAAKRALGQLLRSDQSNPNRQVWLGTIADYHDESIALVALLSGVDLGAYRPQFEQIVFAFGNEAMIAALNLYRELSQPAKIQMQPTA
jgi:hypothetical protein